MSTPVALRWPMPGPFADHTTGRVVACPECRVMHRLVVDMDLDDVDCGEPSRITCPAGHEWLEAGLPRRLAALILAEVLDAEPGLLANFEALQREHGDDQ
nr:hypothetical protein OG999_29320 [Streptomyces sp. NBC_00886]